MVFSRLDWLAELELYLFCVFLCKADLNSAAPHWAAGVSWEPTIRSVSYLSANARAVFSVALVKLYDSGGEMDLFRR